MEHYDAVIIGSGPNGLVAANMLADHGWSVVVLEAHSSPGGAVRSGELTAPGFCNDLFSSFYPLATVSPALLDLDLGSHGLTWSHAPAVVAHPRVDAPAAVLHREAARTAAGLEADHAGSGARYLALLKSWAAIESRFMGALLGPFPPIRAGAGMVRAAGVTGTLDLTRRALLPLRRFLDEEIGGDAAGLLFAGSALHADLAPEMAGSGLFGWILTCVGQRHGFPVPQGGAAALTEALLARLRRAGGVLHCSTPVARVSMGNGRATGVLLADGTPIGARRAVVADCDATALFHDLVGLEHLPLAVRARLTRVERGWATMKVDWALQSPIPWSDPTVVGAGTVHLADSLDELTMSSAEIACGQVPSAPFVVMGQMTTADPTRSPAGTESAWAYTHVPQTVRGDAGGAGITGAWDSSDVAKLVERVEMRVERMAPGFRDRIIERHVRSPRKFDEENANLVGGDINGGTAQLHQQLIFRPIAGTGRPSTPIGRLYLGSASAHPGGGVHGACGANAARAAILGDRARRMLPFS